MITIWNRVLRKSSILPSGVECIEYLDEGVEYFSQDLVEPIDLAILSNSKSFEKIYKRECFFAKIRIRLRHLLGKKTKFNKNELSQVALDKIVTVCQQFPNDDIRLIVDYHNGLTLFLQNYNGRFCIRAKCIRKNK